MPREKIETAFLGVYTLAMLDTAGVEVSGWIIKALAAWILRGTLPAQDEVPPECAPLWAVVVEESRRIHEARKEREESGRRGGKQRASNAQATVKLPSSYAKATATKRESKSEKENSPSGEGSFSAPARKEPASSHIDPGAEFTPSYLDDWAAFRMQAHNAGLTDAQLEAWRDYYAAQGWKFKPTATAPMNRTEALASIRNWARAEKRLEIRDMQKRDPSKFAPSPDKGGIDPAKLGI